MQAGASMSASSNLGELSRAARKRPKWLIITSAKGGSGKTTTARNIAVFAAHAGLSVAMIDCDMQASLTAWFERRPDEAPTLDHYKVPMGQIVDAMTAIGSRQDLDLVIVDTPPGVEAHPQSIRDLMRRSDFVIIPSGQGGPDLASVVEWMRFVRREGRKAAFLLNRTKRSAGSFERAKLRLIEEGHLCPFDVRDLEDIQATHDMGLGVLEVRGASGVEDVRGVWAYVRNELELVE
jgi:chromosome partitioning protein